MGEMAGFSDRLELPHVPEAPGVILLEDAAGRVLQVVMSKNIRRRIGELLDSEGKICVHGPKIYDAQQEGQRLFVRWKHASNYKQLKPALVEELGPAWA